MKQRIVSLLLAAVMLLSLLPSAAWAEEIPSEESTGGSVLPQATEAAPVSVSEEQSAAPTAEGGSFLLLAASDDTVIIEPERVTFQPGDTVMQALLRTEHTFTGMEETGFISAIDGKNGTFSRYDDQGGYNLNRNASEIHAFMIVGLTFERQEAEEKAAALYSMACALLAWREAQPAVQKFSRQQYDAAHEALLDGGDFAALGRALTEKIEQYQQYITAEQYLLHLSFLALDGKTPLTEYTFTAEDPYGNTYTFTQEKAAALAAGTYTFALDSGFSGARGTLTVAKDGAVSINGQAVEAICVPQGVEWITQPVLLSVTEGDPETDNYPMELTAAHASTARLPDTVGRRGALYLYGKPGADVQDGCWNGNILTLTACYTTAAGEEKALRRAWLSDADALPEAVETGMEGNTVRLEARTDVDGYTMYQVWMVALERVPTLCALTVSADGIAQNIGFQSGKSDYTCTVTAETVVLTPSSFGGGYTVTVNGEGLTDGRYTLPLTERETKAEVTVAANGRSRTYTVTFVRVAAAAVTVVRDADVTVTIYNAAGAEIGCNDSGTYPLTPGETYICIATKATFYHTLATFTVPEDGLTVQAVTPETVDLLKKLRLASAADSELCEEYLAADQFTSQQHSYTTRIADVYSSLYVWAEPEKGCTAVALGQRGEITLRAGAAAFVNGGIRESAEPQTLTIRVSQWEGTVQQYQDYLVTFEKSLTIEDVALSVDGNEQPFYPVSETGGGQSDEEAGFDNERYQYYATVVRSAETAVLTVTLPFDDYSLQVNGRVYEPAVDAEGEPTGTAVITLPLSSEKGEEAFVLKSCHPTASGAQPLAYTITLKKGDPISTVISVLDDRGASVDGALAAVYDSRSGTRVWPQENGTFLLVEGLSYQCVVTCAGYVGEERTFVAGEKQKAVTVELTAAPAATHGEGVSSEWPSFRGNDDANGVVDDKTPITCDTAVLSWANQLGRGYDTSAVSCPILITEGGVDFLIVYSGTTLYKVESVTGTVVASGTMSCTSSFAINPPVFGDGMLFVALKDGTVQAFDAATLASLWVYRDPLKGQSNCPVIYHEGYVYTGFWNSETGDANFVCLSATDEDPDQSMETKLARWRYTSAGGFYWAGAYVCDDYLLVGTDDGDSGCTSPTSSLLCIDPDTGAVLDSLENLRGDIRCNIAKSGDRFYFTSKGGYFYSVSMSGNSFDRSSFREIRLSNGSENGSRPPMSTCTPVVYNGRAYIGVSGTSQFGAYSGHNITVIDLDKWSIAYSVPTMGYPQTSGLLTTAYSGEDGCVYVYFFDNYIPGKLRMLKDRPGQRKAELVTTESVGNAGETVDAAYTLFTPADEQAEYAICSPISDAYGTMYFKNDSAHLMALTNTVTKLEITTLPNKTDYKAGEPFDPTGMAVTLTYANGKTRTLPASRTINGKTISYFTWDEVVTEDNGTDFFIEFPYAMYQNGQQGEKTEAAAAKGVLHLTVQAVSELRGDVTGDGAVNVYDLQRMYEHCSAVKTITNLKVLMRADCNQDGEVDIRDMQALYCLLTTGQWESSSGGGDTHAITVQAAAPATLTVRQGEEYRLSMDNVFTGCGHEMTCTLSGEGLSQHTKLAKDSEGRWYLLFTDSVVGQRTLTLTATCTQDKTVTVSHTITVTVAEGSKGNPAQYNYDESNASSVTVYVTISNDGVPIIGNDSGSTVLSRLKVTVPYFDLANYDLEEFYRYGTANGSGVYVNETLIRRPTLLHLYLYLLGVYCQGESPEAVVSGTADIIGAASQHTNYRDLLNSEAPQGWGEKFALNITGSPTSLYMEQFWGHDENLMYYRNHMYPLMSSGWGSTADYILLSDGDVIDLAMFSDWEFYTRGAFACFDRDTYTVAAGEKLSFSTMKYDTKSVSQGGGETMQPVSDLTVYVYDEDWSLVSSSALSPGDSGADYEYVFSKSGSYYLLAVDPAAGTNEACYAPAVAAVTVS